MEMLPYPRFGHVKKRENVPAVDAVVDDNQMDTPIKMNPGRMASDMSEILHILLVTIVKYLKS